MLMIAFYLKTGTTPGKYLMKIRQIVVREMLDGTKSWEPLGIVKYIFNTFFVRLFFMAATMGLSAVWPLFDSNGQFPGDRLLGIFTVEASSLEPPVTRQQETEAVSSRL